MLSMVCIVRINQYEMLQEVMKMTPQTTLTQLLKQDLCLSVYLEDWKGKDVYKILGQRQFTIALLD